MSTRVAWPDAFTTVVSPGTSNRLAFPVVGAMLMPLFTSAAAVSNAAATPTIPALSLNGNVSWRNCQMSTEIRSSVPPSTIMRLKLSK